MSSPYHRGEITERGGRLRNGLKAVPVASAVRLRSSGETVWWDIVLECGHELKAHPHKSYSGRGPRWAGCRACTGEGATR